MVWSGSNPKGSSQESENHFIPALGGCSILADTSLRFLRGVDQLRHFQKLNIDRHVRRDARRETSIGNRDIDLRRMLIQPLSIVSGTLSNSSATLHQMGHDTGQDFSAGPLPSRSRGSQILSESVAGSTSSPSEGSSWVTNLTRWSLRLNAGCVLGMKPNRQRSKSPFTSCRQKEKWEIVGPCSYPSAAS